MISRSVPALTVAVATGMLALSAPSGHAMDCRFSPEELADDITLSTGIPELLFECAKSGDPVAQTRLATLYWNGTGISKDETEAAWWYQRAARQGVPEAQFMLGVMYLEGEGVTENSSQALHWISKAARNNYPQALEVYQYILNNDAPLAC